MNARQAFRLLVAAVGLLAVLVAVVVLGVPVVAPGTLGPYRDLIAQVSGVVSGEILVWSAVGLWCYGGWRVLKRGFSTSDASPLQDDATPPETAVTDADIVGRSFDTVHETAVDEAGPQLDDRTVEAVREHLRGVATTLFDDSHSPNWADGEHDVETRLDAGTWTDDEIAAAFLGADGPYDPSLRERVRVWLFPRAVYRERVERTVRALETTVEQSMQFEARADGGRSAGRPDSGVGASGDASGGDEE